MKKISDTFCVLPWIHVYADPGGYTSPCCISKDSELRKEMPYRFGVDKISDVWNSEFMRRVRLQMINGERVPSCQYCYNDESFGMRSKRMIETTFRSPENIDDMVHYSKNNNGESNTYPTYFDLRFGNLCNLRCRMCSSYNSSQIQKEQITLKSIPEYYPFNTTAPDSINEWFLTNKFWDDIENYIEHIDHIYFTGGEPTLIEQQYEFLNKIIERGYHRNMLLRYNINATNIQSRFLDLINQFKQVDIACSIDGVGEVNNYIRNPSKWEQIETNMKRLITHTESNVSVDITHTLQALNILHLSDTQQWLNELNTLSDKNILMDLNVLYSPTHLAITILTQNQKNEALSILDNLDKTFIMDHESKIIAIKNKLHDNEPSDILELRKKFKQHMNILDKSRNENLLDVLPELKDLY